MTNLLLDSPRREGKELKIRNEKGEISMDTAEIQKNIKILWTIICQQIWQPRKNGQLSGDIEHTETESRNRSIEHTDH